MDMVYHYETCLFRLKTVRSSRKREQTLLVAGGLYIGS